MLRWPGFLVLFAIPIAIGTIAAFAQRTPQELAQQQIRQDAQQHQAQVDEMRQIERRGDEQHREQERQAQTQAAQQQLLIQQQQAAQQQQQRQAQSDEQTQAPGPAPVQPLVPASGQQIQQVEQLPAPYWSFSNISNRDRIGLAALGIVLVALAFAAGIVPTPSRR